MCETSEEIVKLISKYNDLIGYFSTAREQFEVEITKLRNELNQQKAEFNVTIGGLRNEVNQLRSSLSNIPQQGWQKPNLLTTWEEYGGSWNKSGYFKDSFGIVHLRGLVRKGAVGSVIFTLPAGYRPARKELFAVCNGGSAHGRVDVSAAGEVLFVSGIANWVSLDGLTFRAA
jgi:hypothetical protein